MTCYKILTLSLYLQNQYNYQGTYFMIEIKYCFWLKNNFGQYYIMKIEWWYRRWLNLMNHLVELMEPLNSIYRKLYLYMI